MPFHWCDNLHTTVFSPRDYQIELLAAAYERNTMVCLGHKSSKEFIALKLLQEIGRHRRNFGKSFYLSINKAPAMYTMLKHLTDLRVYQQTTNENVDNMPLDYDVYILQPNVCLRLLRNGYINVESIQIFILEDCHQNDVYNDVINIFKEFYCMGNNNKEEMVGKPKVLGLAGPLHSAGCALSELSAMLNTLERSICSKTETASDIVTVLRYCAKPLEFIVQCAPYSQDELTFILRDIILTRKAFLDDHRYDPFEIYSTDEFLEELKDIPDPKKEPLEFLNIILNILEEMGPWCTDKVALNMYQRIEKQKIKTPHERHYILLCLVNTALLEIHAICEQYFRKCKMQHTQLVKKFSTPKVLRLLEVLRLFKPEERVSKYEKLKKITADLDQMDFQKITRLLETKCHIVEQTIEKQQLQSRSIIENLDNIIKPEVDLSTKNIMKTDVAQRKSKTDTIANLSNSGGGSGNCIGRMSGGGNGNIPNRSNHNFHQQNRPKRRTFGGYRRYNRDLNDSADNLCAIIYCNSKYTARVLFDLLAEMSRCDPSLKFLKCQYTTDRVNDPLTEPKEAEAEHRRQEEVLKRFRMHDCNVLIGTTILEEGIDVPKCNLVIRWDPPTTYRSYVQCKGRARAIPAYHIILVAANSNVFSTIEHKREQLSDASHRLLCDTKESRQCILSDSEKSESDKDDEDYNQNRLPLNNGGKFIYESHKGKVKILNPEVITNKPPITTSTAAVTSSSCSDLVLKEIHEDIPDNLPDADVTDKDKKERTKLSKTGRNLIEDTKDQLNTFEGVKLLYDGKDLKVYDINDLYKPSTMDITEVNEQANKNKKEKKYFRCLLAVNDNKNKEISQNEEKNDSTLSESASYNNNDKETKLKMMDLSTKEIVKQIAYYREIEKILLANCANREPPLSEHQQADIYNNCVQPYKPLAHVLTAPSVDLSNAIALVNKYCAKLPSDTFTKLTPLWRCARTVRNNVTLYQCTLRLPINSPLKFDIVGLPMPSQVLARRIAALQACIELHKRGELDQHLQPIGKESFKAIEADWENFELEEQDDKIVRENSEPRPGTTKRRQYYYKRIASEFCGCRPIAEVPCYLYLLDLTLQCPIPEEQNTRGRKIYPPEDAAQGFGILTLKKIPKVSSFPIFTRSGEVKVSLQLHPERVILNERQITSINTFINYTFTKVLRLKKFLMLFDPESTENCIFIVPIIKRAFITETVPLDGENTMKATTITNNINKKSIDWKFLELIERNANMMPTEVPEDIRHATEFDADKFKDAVVMPWYRNQDQPHYFYVAEICNQLSPLSTFPSKKYLTFKHYYNLKYGLNIHPNQPLLDVDHTSARLNFLTPRYVNRKGVALPTSSEATKRAKRENLELKQILVPELCTVHPFPASLWRTAVCLPCILYRINGLLLADEIRKQVVADIGLGQLELPEHQQWPMLNFGWSLSDVLKKSSVMKKSSITADNLSSTGDLNGDNDEKLGNCKGGDATGMDDVNVLKGKTINEIVADAERKLQKKEGTSNGGDGNGLIEIGTWSNDMADNVKINNHSGTDSDYDYYDNDDDDDEHDLMNGAIPSTIKFCRNSIIATSPTFKEICLNDKRRETVGKKMNMNCNSNNFGGGSLFYDSDASFTESSFASDDNDDNDFDFYDDDDDDDDDYEDDIAFTSKNEAETIETEEDIEKFNKQISIIEATKENERNYQKTKNLQVGYDFANVRDELTLELETFQKQFGESTSKFIEEIESSGTLVAYDKPIKLPTKKSKGGNVNGAKSSDNALLQYCNYDYKFNNMPLKILKELLPYIEECDLQQLLTLNDETDKNEQCNRNITIPTVEMLQKWNLKWLNDHPNELYVIDGCGDIFDSFNDNRNIITSQNDEKFIKLDYFRNNGEEYLPESTVSSSLSSLSTSSSLSSTLSSIDASRKLEQCESSISKSNNNTTNVNDFSFDYQPDLLTHPGPSPSIILQALTMSNANDGINLERLETIGDSFLKYAITTYLYITYENVHEGKLSHLRSKQVANLNLYRLGRCKRLGEYMIATKFEPSDNWLPPCYYVPKELEKALIEAKIPPQYWSLVDLVNIKKLTNKEICELVRKKADEWGFNPANEQQNDSDSKSASPQAAEPQESKENSCQMLRIWDAKGTNLEFSYFIPYNLVSQHSIPDKSVADCVEALIGAYLIECGLRGALLFMAWLGIRVLPYKRIPYNPEVPRIPGSTLPNPNDNMITIYGSWSPPKSPLLRYAPNAEETLDDLLRGYDEFENILNYKFRDRSYLLQAMTHASYTPNRLTDCYQRLEFLGDAVLDYLITRHLYEDSRQHSPGALTDLRSALVNNTIFASLAVRHGFHKYFRHLSPALNDVIDRFVRIQTENGHSISEEYYLLSDDECDDAEDVEVPKALGDVFESVAGAIFLDSCMSLDEVWRVYKNMMGPEIEQFSNSVPKSPIRELLELEPETAKFGKPEKLADGRRVRVTVEVFCKGTYRGIGRNYRIAKCTAAKCALRQLKKKGFINKKT